MKKFLNFLRPFLLVAVIAVIFVVALHIVDACTRNKKPQPAPDATLVAYDGTALFSLSDNRGKTGSVVVFFDPLQEKSAGPLADLLAANNGRADIIGISVSKESMDTQKEAIQKLGVDSARILFDLEGTAAKTYGISGVPVTYFIDKDGMILDAHLSGISAKTMEKCLNKIA